MALEGLKEKLKDNPEGWFIEFSDGEKNLYLDMGNLLDKLTKSSQKDVKNFISETLLKDCDENKDRIVTINEMKKALYPVDKIFWTPFNYLLPLAVGIVGSVVYELSNQR